MFKLIYWLRYASPQTFYPLAGRMVPWFAGAAATGKQNSGTGRPVGLAAASRGFCFAA